MADNQIPSITSRYLETCEIVQPEFKIEPFAIVIFGGAGDLSKRKLIPTLYHLFQDHKLPELFSILGFGLQELSDEAYRNLIKEAIKEFSPESFNEKDCFGFIKHLFYLSGDLKLDTNYKILCDRIEDLMPGISQNDKKVIYYLAVPPTFIAAKLFIDNWRWAGVPFYIRTGKRLPQRITEIAIEFKHPPLRLLGRACDILEPNLLILSIQPQEGISLRFSVKLPGERNQPYPVEMDFNYAKSFKLKTHSAYERLLMDCMRGDLMLFARQDGVEAMWSVVDPIISYWGKNIAKNFPNYSAGT